MIAQLIRWSVANRFLVVLATVFLAAAGVWGMRTTPVDALPDLSDVQVIIRTSLPGQAPQIVENQVTYPLATTMLSVPGAKTVRGFSFFGDSFVYVLFDDGTDLYWARSRVLEYLNQVQGRLPAAAKSSIGPDATGVGWIFQYALVDRSGRNDLSQLRALQDWFLKYELKALPGVAEVATVGGMNRQYQVVLDPLRLAAYGVTHGEVREALRAGNQEAGGSVLELAEAEYMVRASGYLETLDDFRAIPLAARRGVPVRLGDVATVQVGPEMRRGIAELDGQGEVTGGVVILRSGENPQRTIAAVKARLAELQASLPPGVEVVTTYDRSALIGRAIDNLTTKLIEEFIVVAAVCVIFLWHLRSALVAIIALPLGVMTALLIMRWQGINANIMSLGGIAIAIGAMVDAAVVMIENAHKKVEAWQHAHPGESLVGEARWKVITDAAEEVGPALFFSLLIITLSFVPVFTLQAQEGRLFGPLAFTKTYAMAAAAALSVTLIPVLMGAWIRGRIPDEGRNPITRALIAVYRPALEWVLRWPKATLVLALVLAASTVWPLSRLGGEFLPRIDEGDLLYMPSALPGLSAQKATELLQITNRMIATVPEVEHVFGKAGRAETATDPAPLEMFETTVKLKPRDQWRPGMTPEKLVDELDAAVQVPGLANIWIPPIRNRIDMLATGIKSPIGVKVTGSDLAVIDRIAQEVERVARAVPGVSSSLAERLTGGRYVDVRIDRVAAARYGLNIADVQAVVSGAIGGENVAETVEGLARFPINLRYMRSFRDSVGALSKSRVTMPSGESIPLGNLASISIHDGPTEIKSENGRLVGYVYINTENRDMGSYIEEAQSQIGKSVKPKPGYAIAWAGQYAHLEHAKARLYWIIPLTLLLVCALLYLHFRDFAKVSLVLLCLPFSLVGGIWFVYLLDYPVSVAVIVGFIALAGVATGFGAVMRLYPDKMIESFRQAGRLTNAQMLREAIVQGAVLRLRPKMMTVSVIIAGLLPMMYGQAIGADVMKRIAAPLIGGMVTAPFLSLIVIPVVYLWWHEKILRSVNK